MQEEAQLTEEQISKLLAARQILLLKMTDITSARRDIFSQLGLEMLALPEVSAAHTACLVSSHRYDKGSM